MGTPKNAGLSRPGPPGRAAQAALVVGLALAAASAGCTATGGAPGAASSPGSTAPRRAAPATAPPATARVTHCSGDDEVNQDDDNAMNALLDLGDLPPGEWVVAPRPPCPYALSVDDLLAVGPCLDAAGAGGAPANDEARNGNGRVTYVRVDGVQLDDRAEIYTSRQNVDALRAVLAGPSAPACFEAALHQRARANGEDQGNGDGVTNVVVQRFAVQPDAAALAVGFPASPGYAADPGFVEGFDITFGARDGSEGRPVAMRVVTFGSGGLVRTITLASGTRAELDGVPLTDTLVAAGQHYREAFGLAR